VTFHLPNQRVNISGGQQARVGLARCCYHAYRARTAPAGSGPGGTVDADAGHDGHGGQDRGIFCDGDGEGRVGGGLGMNADGCGVGTPVVRQGLDLVLLDDVLAAVDAHVGEHIWRHAVCGILAEQLPGGRPPPAVVGDIGDAAVSTHLTSYYGVARLGASN